RFGGDTVIIGHNLETSGGQFQIVGVAEPGLTLPMPGPFSSQSNVAGFTIDVWTPMQLNPAGPFYNSHQYVGVGRLRPGVSADSAQREFTTLARRFSEILPTVYNPGFLKQYNFRTEVSGLQNAVLGPTIPRALWMVFASVVVVLLIAVANVANLFIVRMEARRRESAIRTALGASTGHMATHYLSESLLLCGAAAVAGIALAFAGLHALLLIAPTNIPRLASVTMSGSSIAVAAGITLILGFLLGVIPLARRVNISTLREGGRGLSSSPRQRAVRSVLVIGQVALALVLLAGASLMARSFMHLREVKPGFDPSNVTAFDLSLPFTEYDKRDKALVFHRELQRQILEIPGVVAVGNISDMPLEGFGTGCTVVFREQEPYGADEKTPCVSAPYFAPGFFEALKIPVRGRAPTWNDIDTRSQAVVVTKALADRIWPGKDPIGKGINSNGSSATTWYRVVGVVDNLRAEALENSPTEAVFYAPTSFSPDQRDGSVNDLMYLVRTSSAPSPTLMKRINELVMKMNPRVPIINARTMSQVVEHSMSRTSFIMILLGVAALAALALSTVGMYGVISYVVALRRGEIGIRIALGAGSGGVARLIVMQSVKLATIGIVIGVAFAYFTGKTLASLLFEVTPGDPLVLAGVSVLLVGIAAAASLAPARRAARIDPLEAMRTD
ncbi:MAG: FtsX-like permease family protein, partial [Gemmatimonadaceae bacterium]